MIKFFISISALALALFIVISLVAPSKDKTLSILYPKSPSSAATINNNGFALDTPIVQTVNQQFTVRLYASSDLQASNLFSAKLIFPQNLINVVSFDNTNSFISSGLWAEETFDNSLGTLAIVGGVAEPGVQTISGTPNLMTTIVFKAVTPGSGTIAFDPTSSIYSNSNNQNIIISNTSSTFTINPLPTDTLTPTIVPTSTPTSSPTPTPKLNKNHTRITNPTPTPTPVFDNQAPSTPTGLSASAVSSSQINLVWSPSTDNIGVAGYNIYRNSIFIAKITNTSFGDTGLNPSTTYTYTISAYDQAGNTSSLSAPISATTQVQSLNTGNISGTISSVQNGNPLSNVAVCVLVVNSTKCNGAYPTVYSSTTGIYTLSNISSGTYSVKFSLKSYKTQTLTISVISGQTTNTNVRM